MKITFTMEPGEKQIKVFATLVYEKMRKVKKVDLNNPWWSWRTYALRKITKKVMFGEFTPTSLRVLDVAGLLKDTELDPKAFKKLRQTAKKLIKNN